MLLHPEWPAPANIAAVSSLRQGPALATGVSQSGFGDFNLALHVGDDPAVVEHNRQHLLAACEGLREIAWLKQVHSTRVAEVQALPWQETEADAAVTQLTGVACTIMTADCLPVLFCSLAGDWVGAAHAGWRGLCGGVLANTVAAFSGTAEQLMAWIGPGISQPHFEVGAEVREAFLSRFAGLSAPEIDRHFLPSPHRDGHFLADLSGLAAAQLRALGLAWVGASEYCTFRDHKMLYSFRRDHRCGRQASLIYIND